MTAPASRPMHPFHRTELLVGGAGFDRLTAARVAVIGLGGVGAQAAEAVVRAGVGHVTMVDFDKVCVTNVNRQLHATRKTVGERKADLMAERARQINPQADIRGLVTVSPTVGWGLMMGSLAILGMPPFGVFASEFLILTTAMRQEPWSTPILVLALGIAVAAVFRRVQPMVFGETTAKRLPQSPALLPVFAHLALVLLLGVYSPPYLADWYRMAAALIAGE